MRRRFNAIALLVCSIFLPVNKASAASLDYNFQTLDVPGAIGPAATGGTYAQSINDLGQVVGYYRNNGLYGFLYSSGTYTTIQATSDNLTFAQGINNLGQIVGSTRAGGFFYSGGIYQTIVVPGSIATEAVGINSTGQIVGYYVTDPNSGFGYLDNNGTFSKLGAGLVPTAINNHGEIVGYAGTQGFTIINGVYSTVSIPGVGRTMVEGVNDAGDLVGYYQGSTGNDHGFLWKDGIFCTIDDPLAQYGTLAFGINNQDQIVGTYSDVNGDHAFLASPVPEASTWAMMIIGFCGLGFLAYRKKSNLRLA